jgi:hypothetical protein
MPEEVEPTCRWIAALEPIRELHADGRSLREIAATFPDEG